MSVVHHVPAVQEKGVFLSIDSSPVGRRDTACKTLRPRTIKELYAAMRDLENYPKPVVRSAADEALLHKCDCPLFLSAPFGSSVDASEAMHNETARRCKRRG